MRELHIFALTWSSMPAEYSRRQDTRWEYPPKQDTRRNTRLSRTTLKHNDKQRRGSNGNVVCPRNTAGDRTKKQREYPPKQDSAKTQ